MKIRNLVDKVEPFEFPFDGEVLKGEYYKWKTQTLNYAKAAKAQIPDEVEQAEGESDAAFKVRHKANLKARNEAAEKVGIKAFLVDTIKSWDLTDVEGGEVVPPSLEVLEQLPKEFSVQLFDFFDKLRNPKPNPSTASLTT